METLTQLFDYLLNIDTYLISFVSQYGVWAYIVLFAIIFCETGLVITPFLPGDSLLFAAGSIAAAPQRPLNIQFLLVLLMLASILGNKVNYLIGRAIGPRVFNSSTVWLNKKHLIHAHNFYEKHGGKTIIFARFLPIIRTFVPFIAGVGYMEMRKFNLYNIVSGIVWVGSLIGAGYFLGNLPFVQQNFSLVIYGIIGFSLLLPGIVYICKKIISPARGIP